jgi:hypothetical protein
MLDLSNVTDSRDIEDRINELTQEGYSLSIEEEDELTTLKEIKSKLEVCSDWEYGELIINEDYFVEYTKEHIHDCYEIEEQQTTWPYRHQTFDYEAAAEELKNDYISAKTKDGTYLALST